MTRRETLLDFFEDFATRDESFIVHDNGYRVREVTYRGIAQAARAFSARLAAAGVVADDKVVVWSENRAEWVAALWGCLLARVVLVPVDYRASASLLERIVNIVRAKAILVGDEVKPPDPPPAPIWHLGDTIDLGEFTDSPIRRFADSTNQRISESGNQRIGVSPTTLAEIIFTSGATADPKGVTITHRNVLANIIPIEREVTKYLLYERPFHPIRFLNLLPLSHMFGQSMATFVPPMLGGTVIFSHGYSPVEVLHQIRSRRVSVLVCVPKVLDVLRAHVERVAPDSAAPDVLAGKHFLWRWWKYRHVHRLFGWKFWCIVCGAAPLDPALEAFWRKLGFLVVQGYGLTETAPVVTLNHPFRASQGTVGTPIAGVDVRIAPDGEILVRGENVTSGYYRPEGGAPPADDGAFHDGWFHTGDVGELDASGRLLIKGRKKEMIVTPQGLNVFPEDVERALLTQPGIRDACVVGVRSEGEERIHAVLVVAEGADVRAAVREANATLEDHQRVWSTAIWPGDALPRTEGTQKLKRREIQRWAAGESSGAAPREGPTTVEDVVARFAGGRTLEPGTTLGELGLSSLDRVGLMMALEEAFQTTLDEAALGEERSIAEIKALVGPMVLGSQGARVRGSPEAGASAPASADIRRSESAEAIRFPSWNRTWPAWLLRRVSLPTWILPLARVFMQLTVRGREHLRDLKGPVVFAANHQSHMDGPAIFIALPARWRYRLAPAMSKEFFRAHFFPEGFTRKKRFMNSLWYYLSCQFFNAFPLPQREAGTRQTLRYIGEVLADEYSVLIFPEGRRSTDGALQPFRPGIGMIGSRLDVPVVPVRIEGLIDVLHPKMRFPKRGPVTISFGAPIRLSGDDYPALAKQVEDAVQSIGSVGRRA